MWYLIGGVALLIIGGLIYRKNQAKIDADIAKVQDIKNKL